MDNHFSSSAITKLLNDLPKQLMDDASPTYLPTVLPLALPTPLHTLNFFTNLHLIHHTLLSPTHTAYFHETKTTPRDTAIRGTVSLFLASEEGWKADNLLSTDAWKKGKLDERAISEHFEITILREREHETMKAIRVGERWNKAVEVTGGLVGLFAGLGEKLSGKCVGEAVQGLVEESQEVANGDVAVFARVFTEQAAKLVPDLQLEPSSEETLPAAPLHLLQDLAYRQYESSDLGISLPPPDELADVSPLPLSLSFLLQSGVVSLDALPSADQQALKAVIASDLGLDATAESKAGTQVEAITISKSGMDTLAQMSLAASTEIRWATQTQEWTGEAEWKGRLSFYDIWRISAALEERTSRQGKGMVLIAE